VNAAEALEELAGARLELRDATHTAALVKMGLTPEEPPPPGLVLRRREIELRVAELRISLWSEEVRRCENAVRRHGIRP
jgi:hypothetical protein